MPVPNLVPSVGPFAHLRLLPVYESFGKFFGVGRHSSLMPPSKRQHQQDQAEHAGRASSDQDKKDATHEKQLQAGGGPNETPLVVSGILTGLDPAKDKAKVMHIYNKDANHSVEYLFGSLDGAPLVDAILQWFGDCEMELPWFFTDDSDGCAYRTIQRHPLSRKIQEKTVLRYKNRILSEGLSQLVSGRVSGLCWTKDSLINLISVPSSASNWFHRTHHHHHHALPARPRLEPL